MSQLVFIILFAAAVYFLGLIPPIGNMYAFFFSLLRIAGRSVKEMIVVLNKLELMPTLIFLILGILVIGADCFLAYVSLPIIYPEASVSLPDALGQLFSAMSASQFIAPAFLLGAIILEMGGYISPTAHLFNGRTFKRGFRWYMYSTLVLTILLGTSFYLAKGVYLYLQNITDDPTSKSTADPTGIMHWLVGMYPLLIILVLSLSGLVTLLSAPLAGYSLVKSLQLLWQVVCSLASGIASLIGEEVTYCQAFFSRSLSSYQEKPMRSEVAEDTQVRTEVLDQQKLNHAAPALLEEQKEPVLPEPEKKVSVLVPLIRPLWIERKKEVPLDEQGKPVTGTKRQQVVNEQTQSGHQEEQALNDKQAAPALVPPVTEQSSVNRRGKAESTTPQPRSRKTVSALRSTTAPSRRGHPTNKTTKTQPSKKVASNATK